MDLTLALECCASAIKTLRSIPKRTRIPDSGPSFVSRSRLLQAKQESLSKCIPYLNELLHDILNCLNAYDDAYFEAIKNRQLYIECRFEENSKEIQDHADKTRLISDIENLEKMNVRKLEKVVFSEVESAQLIQNLHSLDFSPEHQDLEDVIRRNVEVKYDSFDPSEIEAFKRIIDICNSHYTPI